MGSLSLPQGIFPTQESNPGLPHCRWILYQLSCKGRPKILDWVVYPFYSGSSWPRNWTRVSCIAGRFFTNWAISIVSLKCVVLCLVTQSCLILCEPMDCSLPGSSVHGASPGRNTAVGCHSLFHRIFQNWRSNSSLLLCRWILYNLSHRKDPKIKANDTK